MSQWFGAWDGRRRAITLGIFSNVVGALAAAGAAVAAWATTAWQADLTSWALILAGIGGVFVAKGTIILALAESRRFGPAGGELEMQKSIRGVENRLSSRQKAMAERLSELEAEVERLRVRS